MTERSEYNEKDKQSMMNEGVSHSGSPDESQHENDELVLRSRMSRVKRKLLVLSGKGGVGKSTVAANLAVAMAATGQAVGLLDVDLHGPSITTLFGLDGGRLCVNAAGEIEPIRVMPGLQVVSIGLLLERAEDPVIWRGPRKYGAIRQFLSDVAWGELDCLIIDSPPGTGDEPLSVAQLAGDNTQAVLVTTPQSVAVADVRRSISFCRALSMPILGLIENMSGFTCPECGRHVDLFGRGGGEKLAEESGVRLLGKVPLDPGVTVSGDTGRPFIDGGEESPAGRAFMAIIRRMNDQVSSDQKGSQAVAVPVESKAGSIIRIAVPMQGDVFSAHFGKCDRLAMIDMDRESRRIHRTFYLTPPPHEPGVLPRWLYDQKADVVIAGGIGQKARVLFEQAGIEVVVGAMGEDPEAIAMAYIEDRLEAGDNVCTH